MRQRSQWGSWVGLFLTALVVGWIGSFGAVLFWAMRDTAAAADAIVVMGAAQYAGRPSPVLRSRLDHALALWRQGLAQRVLLTGGKGMGDTLSEAAVGRSYLSRHGVPASALLVEEVGRTTEQSIEAAAEMLRSMHLGSAIFVSDPFHMLRVDLIARGFGLRPFGSPTRTSPISANRMRSLGYLVSESAKVPLTLLVAARHRLGR